MRQIFEERTPTHKTGKRAKVFYATQIDVAPPTIVLFVNNPNLVDGNYQRFMINRFRELLPYAEVPIKLLIRERSRTQDSAGSADRGYRARRGKACAAEDPAAQIARAA